MSEFMEMSDLTALASEDDGCYVLVEVAPEVYVDPSEVAAISTSPSVVRIHLRRSSEPVQVLREGDVSPETILAALMDGAERLAKAWR